MEAKAGAGSATLSMAYAAVRFAESVMKALTGEKGVMECAYLECDTVGGDGILDACQPTIPISFEPGSCCLN